MEPSQELYDKAVKLSWTVERVNCMFFQRHLNVGYGTALKIMDRLEKDGLISRKV